MLQQYKTSDSLVTVQQFVHPTNPTFQHLLAFTGRINLPDFIAAHWLACLFSLRLLWPSLNFASKYECLESIIRTILVGMLNFVLFSEYSGTVTTAMCISGEIPDSTSGAPATKVCSPMSDSGKQDNSEVIQYLHPRYPHVVPIIEQINSNQKRITKLHEVSRSSNMLYVAIY